MKTCSKETIIKVVDQDKWQGILSTLEIDEAGQWFRAVLIDWVDLAEKMMDHSPDHTDLMPAKTPPKAIANTPIRALRATLAPIEGAYGNEDGRIPAAVLGQLIIVIANNWIHGDAVVEELTPFELRLIQDVYATQLAELQEAAAVPEEMAGSDSSE